MSLSTLEEIREIVDLVPLSKLTFDTIYGDDSYESGFDTQEQSSLPIKLLILQTSRLAIVQDMQHLVLRGTVTTTSHKLIN